MPLRCLQAFSISAFSLTWRDITKQNNGGVDGAGTKVRCSKSQQAELLQNAVTERWKQQLMHHMHDAAKDDGVCAW